MIYLLSVVSHLQYN